MTIIMTINSLPDLGLPDRIDNWAVKLQQVYNSMPDSLLLVCQVTLKADSLDGAYQ